MLLVSSGQEGPISQSRAGAERLILTSHGPPEAAGLCSSAGFPEPEMASSVHVRASHHPCPTAPPAYQGPSRGVRCVGVSPYYGWAPGTRSSACRTVPLGQMVFGRDHSGFPVRPCVPHQQDGPLSAPGWIGEALWLL